MLDDLIPVSSSSFKLGEPIAFSIYDKKGTLLIKAGVVVTLQKQIDRIIAEGLCVSEKEVLTRRWMVEKKELKALVSLKPSKTSS